ncbi:hypothetical protein BN1180_01821 [Peribacillus simplex]|uniref:Uncharacterized protein n=1 Tax=Peribacillus simplex TaxID=1478 RepID=A0AAN2PHL2_9BACI|nr:hypothetical protein BN1180_01821 [Peribacillus simplex]CRH70586.1 Uncharacterised protein [Chlamydia trachomatis]
MSDLLKEYFLPIMADIFILKWGGSLEKLSGNPLSTNRLEWVYIS